MQKLLQHSHFREGNADALLFFSDLADQPSGCLNDRPIKK